MRVAVTGAGGFVGTNLCVRIGEVGGFSIRRITSDMSPRQRDAALQGCDAVVHLAGVNRTSDPSQFASVNAELTGAICQTLASSGSKAPVLHASSIQAELDNPYGLSKKAAEDLLQRHAESNASPVAIARLVNLFGKWGRPNYNSVTATFCHRIARGEAVTVHDAGVGLRLLYIDDLVTWILGWLADPGTEPGARFVDVGPEHQITVGALADTLKSFAACRTTLSPGAVGTGLLRKLYATYVSYLPTERFAYDLVKHSDPRGEFVEMLRTPDSGQLSYFTAGPGITRGEHYHHTKTEKFLVIRGTARFQFRDVVNGERYELVTVGGKPRIVETIPGWSHNITNVGEDELIVMLWANELFDRERPDTVYDKVVPEENANG